MLYYSEVLKKKFKTEEECLAAEKEAQEKKSQRQKDAEIVRELQKKYSESYQAWNKALEEFIDKYGCYKTTLTDMDFPLFNGKTWEIINKSSLDDTYKDMFNDPLKIRW